MGFGSRTISLTHPGIEISKPWEFIVDFHHHSTLSELHPHSPWAAPSPSHLTSLIMFLGPGVLVSRARFAQSPPLFTWASLPHLAFAQSTRPFRPCYRQLGLQFAVGENISTGHGPFLHSLHFNYRLPSLTRTRLPIVSRVIGSTPPLTLQVSSRCSVTATVHSLGWHRPAFAAPAIAMVARPGYAQSSYCTVSVADVNALGSWVIVATSQWF